MLRALCEGGEKTINGGVAEWEQLKADD